MAKRQKYMFGEPEPKIVQKDWGRYNDGLGTCGAVWRNHSIDYDVEHCGHPTANFPYTLRRRSDGLLIAAPNGMAFQHLAQAKRAAELLAQGKLEVIEREEGAAIVGIESIERSYDAWELIAPGQW